MGQSDHSLVLDAEGVARPNGGATARRLGALAGRFRLAAAEHGMILLGRMHDPGEAPGPSRIVMAGEIISRMTVLEMINVIANATWGGELLIAGSDGSERRLVFEQAMLVGARSNIRDDRLGEVMYRQGIIDEDLWKTLAEAVTPQKRFGQVCIEQGVIDAEELFRFLRIQTEQLFGAALLVSDGFFAFRTVDEDAEQAAAHTSRIAVQALLMEGVQRIDEMALFRERVPSDQMCPAVREDRPERTLDANAKQVLALCHGDRNIETIARLSGLGEFYTTKAIYHLLQQQQVELHASAQIDEPALRALVQRFNEVLRDIFMAVATYGGIDSTQASLSAWIKGSGYDVYLGEGVDDMGSVDADGVIARFKQGDDPHPTETLHQALHELASFALFSATTTLPRAQEIELARDVGRRLKAIRA